MPKKYIQYYNKAVDLYKDGHSVLTPETVYGSEYYNKNDLKILEKVISEVSEKGYMIALKYHPTWLKMFKSGASPQQCLRAWKNDDPDMIYLDELKHKEG